MNPIHSTLQLIASAEQWSGWTWASIAYLLFALISFLPTLKAIRKRVELNPGGPSFGTSPHFSPQAKTELQDNYLRIQGTLKFWKNQAQAYHQFHLYCLYWSIPVSILIPVLAQFMDGSTASKVFLTVISSHAAVILALYRTLRVEANYKAFRNGESEYYDLYRRMLDDPKSFGQTEQEQLSNYFRKVGILRQQVRNAEIDNFPAIDGTHRTGG